MGRLYKVFYKFIFYRSIHIKMVRVLSCRKHFAAKIFRFFNITGINLLVQREIYPEQYFVLFFIVFLIYRKRCSTTVVETESRIILNIRKGGLYELCTTFMLQLLNYSIGIFRQIVVVDIPL